MQKIIITQENLQTILAIVYCFELYYFNFIQTDFHPTAIAVFCWSYLVRTAHQMMDSFDNHQLMETLIRNVWSSHI